MNRLLSIQQAQQRMRIRGESFIRTTEQRAVDDACGMITANDIAAPIHLPSCAISAMDGIALKAAQATSKMPLDATVAYAGNSQHTLTPHTTMRIFTGASLPQGADTVIAQEDCTIETQQVHVPKKITQGSYVRNAGSDVIQGTQIIQQNTQLTPLHLAACTALGISSVNVYSPLKVSILTTGDELVDPPAQLNAGQIYNSNATLLKHLLTQWQCVVTHQHIADDQQTTALACQTAVAHNDLVITTGGVSVGDADYIKNAAHTCAAVDFWGVSMRPGKPFLFAYTETSFLCGVPGNPVSTLVAACVFLKPFVGFLQTGRYHLPKLHKGVAHFTACTSGRDEWRRVYVHTQDNQTQVHDIDKNESHMLVSSLQANALAYIPAQSVVKSKDAVDYLLINEALR